MCKKHLSIPTGLYDANVCKNINKIEYNVENNIKKFNLSLQPEFTI